MKERDGMELGDILVVCGCYTFQRRVALYTYPGSFFFEMIIYRSCSVSDAFLRSPASRSLRQRIWILKMSSYCFYTDFLYSSVSSIIAEQLAQPSLQLEDAHLQSLTKTIALTLRFLGLKHHLEIVRKP